MSISGKFICAKINGTLIRGVQNWSADDDAQELDGTTAEDQGFAHPDDGVASLSVSMELVIDITTGSITPIQRGTQITSLQLFANINAANPIYTIPLFKVFSSTPRGEINGRFTFSVRGKSQGAYTLNDPN